MKTSQSVQVKDLAIREVIIPITGTSPLIVHAFSKKAMIQIAGKGEGAPASRKHDRRNPEGDYLESKYVSAQGWEGVTAASFKAAMIRGAKMIGMVMKDVQVSFFIKADDEEQQLVRIDGKSRMRTDMVRVGNGAADIRYRAEYPQWSACLHIEFNEGMISLSQLHQLVKAGGYGCGIGEMRPEKGKFNFGRFRLANEQTA